MLSTTAPGRDGRQTLLWVGLIVQSWLIGVGWVIYGGQLFGHWFHDAWLRARAGNCRGHKQPGGEESEPTM